jgi:hypothetical protein
LRSHELRAKSQGKNRSRKNCCKLFQGIAPFQNGTIAVRQLPVHHRT